MEGQVLPTFYNFFGSFGFFDFSILPQTMKLWLFSSPLRHFVLLCICDLPVRQLNFLKSVSTLTLNFQLSASFGNNWRVLGQWICWNFCLYTITDRNCTTRCIKYLKFRGHFITSILKLQISVAHLQDFLVCSNILWIQYWDGW